jgi:4-amino-4-deoxy-L-arabinose transferase-like glycosyltransferase
MTQDSTRLLRYLYPALFLAVLATHVWLCWRVGEVHPIPKYDEAVYADLAREMVRTGAPMRRLGDEPRFYYIHPYLQTFFWSLPLHGSVPEGGLQNPGQAIHNLSRLRWVTTFFSLGTLVMIYAMFSRNAPGFGLLAAALLAFNPLWLKYSHLVYLEIPCGFWVILSWLAFLRSSGPIGEPTFPNQPVPETNLKWIVISGIALGAAVITKYLGLVFAAPLFLMLLLERGKPFAWMVLTFGLTLLTWPAYISLFGSIPEWLQTSFARWSSFQSGQAGDPRTEWGILGLIKETVHQLGPMHSLLVFLGLVFMGVTLFFSIRESRLHSMIGGRGMKVQPSSPFFSWINQGLVLKNLAGAFPSAVFVAVWILSPTKDPKFLVVTLPLLMLAASGALLWVLQRLFLEKRSQAVRLSGPLLGAILFLLAFPIDLLGLDNTRFKKLYPTDHAYTHVALPHGEDYRPIAESIFLRTKPREVIPVGRQGPIVGYLADRPYRLIYTENDSDTLVKSLEGSRFLVIDDTWENCFAGFEPFSVETIRLEVGKEYRVVKQAGDVKLLERWSDGRQSNVEE